jgi:thioredoxin 1
VKDWNKQELDERIGTTETLYVYLYTPICGTCQVAKKMLIVIEELLPNFPLGMCDINYIPEKASEWAVESVPCLLIIKKGEVQEKIYAFRSVDYLYEKLKNN